MEQVKQLTNAIDRATSDALQAPNLELYVTVEKLVNSRADMPKHCVAHISKRLMIKNKKVLMLVFDLLEYVSYQTELPFYSQLATKDFLLRVSGILQSKELDEAVQNKVLCTIRCWQELFRQHQDILPMFFQFYDGLTKKGFDQKKDYVSAYRPKQLKKYMTKSELQKKNVSNNAVQQPSHKVSQKNEDPSTVDKKLDAIKQQIILTNQIIDGCEPQEGVQGKSFLNELMATLKQSEGTLTKIITEIQNEKVMERSIALNDDLVITKRRYKQLQSKRKPEPFIITELHSDYLPKDYVPPTTTSKVEKPKSNNIFEEIQVKKPAVTVKKSENILDLIDAPEVKKQQPKVATNNNDIFNLLDMQPNMNIQPNMNTMSTSINLVPQQNPSFTTNSQFGLGNPPFGVNNQFNQFNNPQFTNPQVVRPQQPTGFNFSLLNNTPPVNQPITFGTTNNSQNQFSTQVDFKQYGNESSLIDLTDMLSKKL